MRRFGVRLLAAAIASSLIVTPVMAAPSIDKLKENKTKKQNEVNSLQQELTDILQKLGDLEEGLIKKGEEIIQAKEDLGVAEEKEKEQYEAMKIRIKYMYEEGSATALESLITAEDFSDLLNKAEYVQNVHTYDRQQLQEYVETKQQIADLKTTLEEDKKAMESMQTEYEAKETQLTTTIETRRAEVADLDEQIQAAAEAAARAAEEQRRREEEERQAAAANNGDNDNNSTGNNNSNTGNNNNSNNNNSNNNNNNSNSNSANNNSGSGSSTGSGSGSGSETSSGNTSAAQTIVNAAYGQLGVDYVWGGTSPGKGLDCSGLVQYCHSVAGISIGRTSEVQGGGGKAVSNPQPGDIVCYGSHVGIYIGGGQMIHAPRTGEVVKVSSVYGSPWYRRYW